jgi:hydrogenase expression/formation protein HypC
MCLAIPGRLVSTVGDGELRAGVVDFGGVSREANLAFVPEAVVGDYLLVHVGFAISVIDEDLARATLEALTMFEALTDGEGFHPATAGGNTVPISGRRRG